MEEEGNRSTFLIGDDLLWAVEALGFCVHLHWLSFLRFF
jgi:hypothetical protein